MPEFTDTDANSFTGVDSWEVEFGTYEGEPVCVVTFDHQSFVMDHSAATALAADLLWSMRTDEVSRV